MKVSTQLLFISCVALAACQNNSSHPIAASPADPAPASTGLANQLEARLKMMDVPAQIFTVPADKKSVIKGRKGTTIFVSPADLETVDGSRPTAPITVELKEITTKSDLMRAGAQTVADGALLASGGSYYIGMYSGGRQLGIKRGRALSVAFPKLTDNEMAIFYGERDKNGQMNWQPTGQKLVPVDTFSKQSIMILSGSKERLLGYVGNSKTYQRDTAAMNAKWKGKWSTTDKAQRTEDSIILARINYSDSVNEARRKLAQPLDETLYRTVNIKQLGWINCDKFVRDAQNANITYTIAAQDSVAYAHIYLVFKDITAAIDQPYFAQDGSTTRSLGAVPIGMKARLIAVTYKKGGLHTCSMDITTAENQHTLIVWKPSTETELDKLFGIRSTTAEPAPVTPPLTGG